MSLVMAVDITIEEENVIDILVEEGGASGDKLPYYTGAYSVTPKVTAQSLSTANRSMAQNIEVLKIPYEEVHNSTGTTVTIGGIL